jgi:hypothetical protein
MHCIRKEYMVSTHLVEDPLLTKMGEEVHSLWVADASGSLLLDLWGKMADDIQPGDMLRLIGG